MNMRIKLLCVVCLMNIFWNMPAFSMPAFPGDISYVQPDGTVVTYRLKGDERCHWIESVDGHILKKETNGYLVYAEKQNDEIVASSVPYRGNDALAAGKVALLNRRSITPQMQAAAPPTLQLDGTFPLTGKRKLLMLLVNFSDTQVSFSRDDFDAMMNGDNYQGTGSFRDFYLENSYQQLDVETTVVGWIQLSKNKNMYSTEDMTALISEALTLVKDQVDFSQFDNDGDGELDGLSIIHQGTGAEVTGSASDIWSHSSELLDTWVNGMRVRSYTIQPELLFESPAKTMMTVGVFCHEFGHNLGAPDFYDVDYEQNGEYYGTGDWDLMAGGAWGVYSQPGDSPCHYTMWQKMQFGWVTPTVLTESQAVSGMPAVVDEPVAYVVNTMRDGDYYVLENRQQVGFDRALPGHGLIIYHADENRISTTVSVNEVNADSEQGLYTVCASSNRQPDNTPESYGDVNSAGTPFPGSSGNTTFSDASLPALHSNDGKYSYSALNNITESNGLVSFSFVKGDVPESVVNFTAAAKRGVVTLTWERPKTGSVKNYRVFRDDALIASPTTEGYVDYSLTTTQAVYKVDVVYTDGLYSPFVYETVRVPENRIADISGDSSEGGAFLQWSMNPLLTRINPSMVNENILHYTLDGAELDVAQRFNAADLKTYVGYRIEKLGFLPFTSFKLTVYELRVWRAPEGTDDFEIVASREASEYATGSWRDMLLKTPVEIEAGYDYLVGFHASSNISTLSVVCDLSSFDEGLGNLVKLDGGEWRDDLLPANIFVRASLVESASSFDFVKGEEPVFKEDYDPLKDTTYPIGFNVYRDDELVGYTSTRCFWDTEATVGYHKYGIACLYEGNNESRILEKSFFASGIAAVTADAVDVSVAGHVVTIEVNRPAVAELYTVDGRLVMQQALPAGESLLTVEVAGVYLINVRNNSLTKTEKIVVK